MQNFNKIQKIIIIILSIISISILTYYVYFRNTNYTELEENVLILQETEEIQSDSNDVIDIEKEDTKEIEETKEFLIVHIIGEIQNPGIVKLPEGSRISDAIDRAGGLTEKADVSIVNLAYILEDGMKIKIPNIEDAQNEEIDTKEEYITSDGGKNVIEEMERTEKSTRNEQISIININKATQTELEMLPGIGPSTALKIITYRDENGDFSNIEDIKNVNGIGDNKYNSIKDLISVK